MLGLASSVENLVGVFQELKVGRMGDQNDNVTLTPTSDLQLRGVLFHLRDRFNSKMAARLVLWCRTPA